jgi:hypothetical protein
MQFTLYDSYKIHFIGYPHVGRVEHSMALSERLDVGARNEELKMADA